MKTTSSKYSLKLVIGGLALAFAACQSHLPKEAMEEIAAYSTAVCKCSEGNSGDAKTCIEALKKPTFNINQSSSSGAPKFKLDSIHQYIDIWGIGNQCAQKVNVMLTPP